MVNYLAVEILLNYFIRFTRMNAGYDASQMAAYQQW